jgi:hypothetical protein
MKKNYFLLIAMALFVNLAGFSQITTYNFNDDNGGWLAKNYCQLSDPVDGSSKINIVKDPDAVPTNPDGGYDRGNGGNQFYHTTANLDSNAGNFLNITLKNTTLNTRVVFFMTDQGGSPNVNIPLMPSDTGFTTYTYDMTDVPAWTGTLNKITMRFRLHDYDPNGTSDLNTEVAAGEVFIDNISITNEDPTKTDGSIYNFNDDNGGWLAKNYTQLSDPVDGSSKINLAKDPNQTPTNPDGGYERGNAGNQFYHTTANVDSSKGNFLNIRLSNNTINTRIVFFMLDEPGWRNVNIPIIASKSEFTTYTYDMTDVAAWTGTLNKITMRFRLHDYNGGAETDLEKDKNVEVATGTILIDDISITQEAPLSVDTIKFKDDTNISVYPNPANDVISIKTARNINKTEVYNILGQLQKLATKNLNYIDVSSLN